MNTIQIVASAGLSSAIGAIISHPIHGAALGAAVLTGQGVSEGVQRYRADPSSSTDSERNENSESKQSTGSAGVLRDLTHDSIRDRLDLPDVLSVNVKENASGSIRVNVEYAGKEQNLRRDVKPEFDVQDSIPNDDGGVHAMLYPNIKQIR